MTFKFIHAADIHLDSPLRGLERHEGAPVERLRGATRRAFENLVDLCLSEAVAFLVIAGDLYDGDWKDFNTGLFFVGQMRRLRETGIQVYVVRGNHDSESTLTRNLALPENVHVFDEEAPATCLIEPLRVALHGQSYATKAVKDDLSAGYPRAVPGYFNIGVLHTCATGRPGHAAYAPCNLETLLAKGYDYWALGHVHAREVLHSDPWILFSGNLQGRTRRESGAKGCTLVTVENGEISAPPEHRPVDVLRWITASIDASDCADAAEVVAATRSHLAGEVAAADGRPLAARIVVHGGTEAHGDLCDLPERWRNEILGAVTDEHGDSVWIEQIQFETRSPLDLTQLAQRDDVLGSFLRGVADLRASEERLTQLAGKLAPLVAQLPTALREGDDALDLQSPESLREVLAGVEQLLIPRLLASAEES